MIVPMQLPSTLTWLIDEASAMPDADQFLTVLGARLIADGLPLAGGALTLSAPHPIIARRTWLWRAETGAVIEALGFDSLGEARTGKGNVGRDWLIGLGTGIDGNLCLSYEFLEEMRRMSRLGSDRSRDREGALNY